MAKYKTYDERNKAGVCAVTRCEAPLIKGRTYKNSLNGNYYCRSCMANFVRGERRYGITGRKWIKANLPEKING